MDRIPYVDQPSPRPTSHRAGPTKAMEAVERVRVANADLAQRLRRVRVATARVLAANDQLAESLRRFQL